MKKVLFGLFAICLLSFATANAQEFYTTNQATINWDQDFGGIPTVEVKWNVYLVNAITDPDKTNPAQIATAVVRPYVVTLNVEGRFFVGVSAVRVVDGEAVGESEITWSDTQVDVPSFGLQYFTIPPAPTMLIKE